MPARSTAAPKSTPVEEAAPDTGAATLEMDATTPETAPETTPETAPETAPETDAEAPTLSPKEARAKKAAEDAAKAAKQIRFQPAEGCHWVDVDGIGKAAVCEDRQGFLYVVARMKGRDVAVPLLAIEALQAVDHI